MRSMSLLVGSVVYFLSHLFSLGSSDRSHNEKRVNMSSLKTVDLKMIRDILPEEVNHTYNEVYRLLEQKQDSKCS